MEYNGVKFLKVFDKDSPRTDNILSMKNNEDDFVVSQGDKLTCPKVNAIYLCTFCISESMALKP
jgi:hypothetical protein